MNLPILGLKNVKAITRITYVAEGPRDYWAERAFPDATEFRCVMLVPQR